MGSGVSPGAFDRLLTALDADRDRAAEAYEHLRERTTGLLRWWGAVDAEDLADVTLDRVARKLEEGAEIADGSFGAYVRGVARMIYYEAQRRPKLQVGDAAHLAPPPSIDHELLGCLDTCLNRLSSTERSLVLRYYADGKPSEVRRRLGVELGVTMTALRIRAHRLRAQLEQCVTGCSRRPETLSPFRSSGSEDGSE
jgi:DNA-directed RNA polymerase specialized sigma24 family protein